MTEKAPSFIGAFVIHEHTLFTFAHLYTCVYSYTHTLYNVP